MTADRGLHVLQRRIVVGLDEGRATHHQPWRTETALHCIVLDERSLNGVELIAMGQTFYRHYVALTNVGGEHHAGGNRNAIDPDGASGACAAVAADLGAGEIEGSSQYL